MTKMYIVVVNEDLIELINEVNEQVNINKGIPQGGIMCTEQGFHQAMNVEIKTGDDEVLPEQIRLMDIDILGVSRPSQDSDPFMQKMIIHYFYKGDEDRLRVDNYDSDRELASKLLVQKHLSKQLLKRNS